VWYYLPGLVLGMLPWSLLLIPFLKCLCRRSAEDAVPRPSAQGFFLLAAGWCFAFFSLAGSKRPGYILPAMPPLALALGVFLDGALARIPARAPGQLGPSWVLFARRLTLLVLVTGIVGALTAQGVGILKLGEGLAVAGAAALAGAGVLGSAHLRRPGIAWTACGAATFGLLLTAVHLALPGYARRFSLRGSLRPQAPFVSSDVPVVCYPRRWDSVSFYLQRSDVQVCTPAQRLQLMQDLRSRPETLLVVKSDHSLQELLRDLPGSLEFRPLGRHGRVTAGLVRPRLQAPDFLFANR